MSGLAGLGAIAGGVSRGLERGQDMAYRAEEMEQRRKLRAREESEREALDYANNKAAQFYRNATTPMPREQTGLTMDDGAMGPLVGVEPQKTAQMSEQDAIYGAMQARTAALAERGATKPWMESWRQTADLRDQLRQRAYERATVTQRQTNDSSAFAKEMYPYVEDGWDLVDAKQGMGLDKQPVINITRRNKKTGAVENIAMNAKEYVDGIHLLMDFKGVRELEGKYALEDYKAQQEIAKETAKGDIRRDRELEVEGVRQRGRLALEDRRTAGDLRVEGARQGGRLALEDKRAKGDLEVAKVRGEGKGGGGSEDIKTMREERLALTSRASQLSGRIREARKTLTDPASSFSMSDEEKVSAQAEVKALERELTETNTEIRELEGELRNRRSPAPGAKEAGLGSKQPPAAPAKTERPPLKSFFTSK